VSKVCRDYIIHWIRGWTYRILVNQKRHPKRPRSPRIRFQTLASAPSLMAHVLVNSRSALASSFVSSIPPPVTDTAQCLYRSHSFKNRTLGCGAQFVRVFGDFLLLCFFICGNGTLAAVSLVVLSRQATVPGEGRPRGFARTKKAERYD
jgi:hypothetical protein